MIATPDDFAQQEQDLLEFCEPFDDMNEYIECRYIFLRTFTNEAILSKVIAYDNDSTRNNQG